MRLYIKHIWIQARGVCRGNILINSILFQLQVLLALTSILCLLMQDKQNLADIIQMHHQVRARQLSGQSDANSLTTYPEYILPYLVHALANVSCPNIDECKDVEAYNTIYRYYFTHMG